MEQNNTVRLHRVGSLTAGVSLIAGGILFLLYETKIISDPALFLKLWPLILLGLGIEILWFNAKEAKFIYDKGAVLLLILMMGFSVMLCFAEIFLDHFA